MPRTTTLFTLVILLIGCSESGKSISHGTFRVTQDGGESGMIFRKGNHQVETYNGGIQLIAKIEYKSDSSYELSGIEINPNDIESVVFLNTYKLITNDKWRIFAIPLNTTIEFNDYSGTLEKIDDRIKEPFATILDSLNSMH